MNELTIVISGQVCRENSANLYSFWNGFINIQKAINDVDNLYVVAHSWNPEFDGLVKSVYSLDVLSSEKQPSFAHEYMPIINPVNRFEKGLKRASSTWGKCSPQALIGNARSRTKAVSLLKKLNIAEDSSILAVRWDQGCTGGTEVNRVVFDGSLPAEYLYMSYYDEIDEGYADMWFVAPLSIARDFEKYDQYVLDSLACTNNYFGDFTNSGWSLAIKRNAHKYRLKKYKKIVLSKFINVVNFELLKRVFSTLENKITGIELRLKNTAHLPTISGENSLLIDQETDVSFPSYQALNNHAILKSFIRYSKLREKTRFLDVNDFEEKQAGQMINPVDFSYLIYSHSSFSDCWEMAIEQALKCLPRNCKQIYLLSEESSSTHVAFTKYSKVSNIKLITYDENLKYTDRLVGAFRCISKISEFVYFVHEDMPLVGEVDSIYLNTLLHFMNTSNEYYIKLVDTDYIDKKDEHDSFPGLVRNTGGYSFSVQPALIKPSIIASFLESFGEDIYGLEKVATTANLVFSAVKGTQKIGKYLLINKKFPHIATAITKGKWCTNEWSDEITYLAKKYSIDLSIRGECRG